MKVKTSVMLSSELIAAINKLIDKSQDRSLLLKAATWEHIARHRRRRDSKDHKLINQHADSLNDEASDVVAYQVEL